PIPCSTLFPYTTLFRSLIESNTFRPMFKYWSPMSVGSWALLIFGIFSLLSFLGALVEDNRLAWPAGRRFRPPGMLSKVIAVIGRSEEHTSELQSPDHLV